MKADHSETRQQDDLESRLAKLKDHCRKNMESLPLEVVQKAGEIADRKWEASDYTELKDHMIIINKFLSQAVNSQYREVREQFEAIGDRCQESFLKAGQQVYENFLKSDVIPVTADRLNAHQVRSAVHLLNDMILKKIAEIEKRIFECSLFSQPGTNEIQVVELNADRIIDESTIELSRDQPRIIQELFKPRYCVDNFSRMLFGLEERKDILLNSMSDSYLKKLVLVNLRSEASNSFRQYSRKTEELLNAQFDNGGITRTPEIDAISDIVQTIENLIYGATQ